MYAIVRIWMVMFALTACTGMGSLDGTTKKGKGEATSEASSADDKGSGGDSIADAPVAVGGTYLVCAVDYPFQGPVSDQTYGCRLESEKKKVVIPQDTTAELSLFANDDVVASSTSPAPVESPWTWVVKTQAKGPFMAELTLRDVAISTVGGLEVKPGSSSYRFTRAAVEGSSLQLVANGGVASLTLPLTQTLDLVGISFASAFPKLMKSSTLAYGVVLGSFTFTGGREITCRYLPSVVAPQYYVFSGGCEDADVPVILSLEDLIAGASAWTVELIDQTGAPANFAIESSVREFRK